MGKKLISEQDILKAHRSGLRSIEIDAETVVTPAARDAAQSYGIPLVQSRPGQASANRFFESVQLHSPSTPSSKQKSVIAVGSDHGGFQLKEIIKQSLLEMGYSVADVGTHSDEACDYPDFAYAVGVLVANGNTDRGIMIDAIGIASAIVANKVPGIRAVPCWNEFVARSSREHNDANVLTLGGRVIGTELAKAIVKAWLETDFAGGRHQGRVRKISDVEKKTLTG
ncbi:MAG: ribose 5-phosphate isomerase B [Ignavibacteria bacterium]|nr:ribose 5-phosphate isomerase B [Ignavibacteria bacterium]